MSHKEKKKIGVSFKINGNAFYNLVRDIMEENNTEKDLEDELSLDKIKFQKAHHPSILLLKWKRPGL